MNQCTVLLYTVDLIFGMLVKHQLVQEYSILWYFWTPKLQILAKTLLYVDCDFANFLYKYWHFKILVPVPCIYRIFWRITRG